MYRSLFHTYKTVKTLFYPWVYCSYNYIILTIYSTIFYKYIIIPSGTVLIFEPISILYLYHVQKLLLFKYVIEFIIIIWQLYRLVVLGYKLKET